MNNDTNGSKRDDGESRIEELKRQVEQVTEGEMHAWVSEECPPAVAEQFWQNVLDYETAPETTHFAHLREAGLELPPPETLSDGELTTKLWELIEGLERTRVFLSQTNHLSDRELYTELWREVLRELVPALPRDQFSAWHIDLLGTGSDEHNYQNLKYFADEAERQGWLASFPDYEMPEHEDPPYDRDARLPQAYPR